MIYYAGIGTREITNKEKQTIIKLANILCIRNCICYSGNAEGSDISFQIGSNGKCVVYLPWDNFNKDKFDYTNKNNCLNYFILGNDMIGQQSINRYHPNPTNLSNGAKKLMSRNYFQVMGYNNYPKIDFIICCADEDKKGNIKGGTGQACRIAKINNIEIINIRNLNWKEKLIKYFNEQQFK